MSIAQTKNKNIIWIGIIAFFLFYILEVVVDFWFGSMLEGYDWTKESISYVGQAGSPLLPLVKIWGVCFTVLLLFYANSFHQVFKVRKWSKVAAIFIVIYALGEGLGSAFFPINVPGTPVDTNAILHNVFGGIGDAALVLFPFMMMLVFPKKDHSDLHNYLWTALAFGLLMASFFLVAKYFHPDNFTLHYKGIWQRLFLINNHTFLFVANFMMIKQLNK